MAATPAAAVVPAVATEPEYLYTLKDAVKSDIESSEHMRARIVAKMLPGWRIALDQHEVFWKPMWTNGRYKKLRALPRTIALQTIRSLKDAALAELRQEADLVHEFEIIDQVLNGEIVLEQGDDDE
jgi:hypothetical protein